MIYFKFNSEEDTEKGFYELITKGSVHCFPDDVFGVTSENLKLLDEANIPYRILEEYEPQTLRNSPAIPL
jgi:hypothetical protein